MTIDNSMFKDKEDEDRVAIAFDISEAKVFRSLLKAVLDEHNSGECSLTIDAEAIVKKTIGKFNVLLATNADNSPKE